MNTAITSTSKWRINSGPLEDIFSHTPEDPSLKAEKKQHNKVPIQLISDSILFSYMSQERVASNAEVKLKIEAPSEESGHTFSKWTLRYFFGFLILLVFGIGVLVGGYLFLIPLLSAFGPLVIGFAFVSLWICLLRARQEHG